MGQVQLAQEEFQLAAQTLENALSSNFKVREHPKYHLLLARVQKHNKEYEKALKTLDGAMKLVRASHRSFSEEKSSPVEFGLSDNMALYLELVAVYRAMGKQDDAKRIMEEAMIQFKVNKMGKSYGENLRRNVAIVLFKILGNSSGRSNQSDPSGRIN